MTSVFKVAVLRARHDSTAELIPDDDCRHAIMSNNDGTSVFQYWEQVTLGEVQFTGSRMFPWVDIEIDPADEDDRGRARVYDHARAATQDAGHDLSDFDAFFVLVHPPQIEVPSVVIVAIGEPGTKAVSVDYGATHRDGAGVAVLRTSNYHSQMAHELGHAIGWNHSYGVLNTGADWDGVGAVSNEYGDPYDIMSAATFGSRDDSYQGNPTFEVTPDAAPGWVGESPFRLAGPAPAQAHLDLRFPSLFRHHRRRTSVSLPEPGSPHRASLWPAASATDGRPTLVALDPPNEDADGRGRIYVEYRDISGWDRGLDESGDDLARRAVVVHRLAHAPDGAVVCWYVGRVVVPQEVDTDLAIAGLPLQVRLVHVTPDLGSVVVELARTRDRAVYLDRTDSERIVDFTPQRTDTVDTFCGPLTAHWGFRRVQTTSSFSVRSYGFGGRGDGTAPGPVASWTVGGQPVDDATTAVFAEVGPGRTVTVGVTLDRDGSRLICAHDPDQGSFEVPVVATVAEADGGEAVSSEPEPYRVEGIRYGYDHSVHQQLDRCIRDIVNKLRTRPNEIFRPPVAGRGDRDAERVVKLRLEVLIDRVRHAQPGLAGELQHLVALRYGAVAPSRTP